MDLRRVRLNVKDSRGWSDSLVYTNLLSHFCIVQRESTTLALEACSDPPRVTVGNRAYGEFDQIIFDSLWFESKEEMVEFVEHMSLDLDAGLSHWGKILMTFCG